MCCRYIHLGPTCPCGTDISLRQALEGCAAMTQPPSPLWDYQAAHTLGTHEFLQPLPRLGEGPMKILAVTLAASPIGE